MISPRAATSVLLLVVLAATSVPGSKVEDVVTEYLCASLNFTSCPLACEQSYAHTWTWAASGMDNSTVVKFRVEYSVPGSSADYDITLIGLADATVSSTSAPVWASGQLGVQVDAVTDPRARMILQTPTNYAATDCSLNVKLYAAGNMTGCTSAVEQDFLEGCGSLPEAGALSAGEIAAIALSVLGGVSLIAVLGYMYTLNRKDREKAKKRHAKVNSRREARKNRKSNLETERARAQEEELMADKA